MTPVRCVVDTNVAVTANGGNEAASQECVAASARALEQVMARGHLFIDATGWIVEEYPEQSGTLSDNRDPATSS